MRGVFMFVLLLLVGAMPVWAYDFILTVDDAKKDDIIASICTVRGGRPAGLTCEEWVKVILADVVKQLKAEGDVRTVRLRAQEDEKVVRDAALAIVVTAK